MRYNWLRVALTAALTTVFACASAGAALAHEHFVYVQDAGTFGATTGRIIGGRMLATGQFTETFTIGIPLGPQACTSDCQSLSFSKRLNILVAATNIPTAFPPFIEFTTFGALTTVKINPKTGRATSVITNPVRGVPDPIDPLLPPLFPTIDFTGTLVVDQGNQTFVYATDRVPGGYPAGNVYAFRLNSNGTLDPILDPVTGAGFDSGDADPTAIGAVGLGRIGNFLIVGNRHIPSVPPSDTISIFEINGDGSLTLINPAIPTGAGIATIYTANSNVYLPDCDGNGQLVVLKLDAFGTPTPVPGSPFPLADPFVCSFAVGPRVGVAAGQAPDTALQSMTLRNGGIPNTILAPLGPVPAFPAAGYDIVRFPAEGDGIQLLIAASNGGAPGGGPGEIRSFRTNVSNSVLSFVFPKQKSGKTVFPVISLPGPNNLTGMATVTR